jgi:hypothetical protein
VKEHIVSYTTQPGIQHWLKLVPSKGTFRVAPNNAIQEMASKGYQHHSIFTSISPPHNNIPRSSDILITVGRGQVDWWAIDGNANVVRITGSASTLNLLFTTSLTAKSARERGVRKEQEFIKDLQTGTIFPGKKELQDLVGHWTTADIVSTGTEKIKRPFLIDPFVISFDRSPVRDVVINGHNVSYKYGCEVRLISKGLIGTMGFGATSTAHNEIANRCRLLAAIGMPVREFNDHFDYPHINVDQSLCVTELLASAFGKCIYFHHLYGSNVIVKDYTTYQPNISLQDSNGEVQGFGNKHNKNIEVKYKVLIDGVSAIASFMLRVDNKMYTKPNILQIKIRYR